VFSEQLEARVAERTQALEIANADLESFAYAVSHELRTPLRGILGFSSVLREQLGQHPSADIEAPLTRIEAYSRRMVALIERMLHYARVGQVALRPQMINCAAMLSEVVAELKPEFEGREIDLAMNADCACRADPVLLRQVFSNLVGNAVKYTRGQRRARVAVDAVRQGNAMVFSVRDNGVGFDPALAGKLFTVFERLHSGLEFEGSGVGLATVERIVERHGGRIWAEARLNEGATFRFTLPIKEEA
jgi:signal transduction histidine kinase